MTPLPLPASARGDRRTARALLPPVLVAALAGASCDGLFYHPDRLLYRHPAQIAAAVEEVGFASADGTALHGWFLRAAPGRPAAGTVLHLHGNAQNLTSHVRSVEWLPAEGFHVFTFDYRGYGRSAGAPDRDGVHADARAALAYVRGHAEVAAGPLFVLGQSLGGAVALAALGALGEDRPTDVAAIAIESSFPSYQGMAHAALGGGALTWPLAWLLIGGEHEPEDALPVLAGIPVLVLHGEADPVVPFSQGAALFEALAEPKTLLRVPGAGHADALVRRDPRFRRALLDFFRAAAPDPTAASAPGPAGPPPSG